MVSFAKALMVSFAHLVMVSLDKVILPNAATALDCPGTVALGDPITVALGCNTVHRDVIQHIKTMMAIFLGKRKAVVLYLLPFTRYISNWLLPS